MMMKCVFSRSDPVVCLNYATFLYNKKDRDGASKQFMAFERRMKELQGSTEIDPEVGDLIINEEINKKWINKH